MGLLDAMFSIDVPHRTVGRLAKDYCVSLSISEKETHILDKFHIDREKFVPERNALLVRLFTFWFIVAQKETANNRLATFHLAKVFFEDQIWKYYDALSEQDKLKMKAVRSSTYEYTNPETAAQYFYLAVSGTQFDLIDSNRQLEFKEFVDGYSKDVVTFIKKYASKLLK